MHETERAVEALKPLCGEDSEALLGVIRRCAEEAAEKALRSRIKRVLGSRGASTEVSDLADKLAEMTGESKRDLLIKALSLYRAALQANAEGNRLAILNPEDEIVREIVGFDPPRLTPQPVEG